MEQRSMSNRDMVRKSYFNDNPYYIQHATAKSS